MSPDGPVETRVGRSTIGKDRLQRRSPEACDGLDDALKWAARIPTAHDGKVEVRPLVDTGGSRPGAGSIAGWPQFHIARAELLTRVGRHGDAAQAYRAALELEMPAPERAFVERRRAALDELD